MMPRPPPLLAIWHFQCPSECQWMRAGQDCQRCQPLRVSIRDLPAILVTADRSAHVREEARAAGIHILNKPVKPASLRALITQWRVQRVAAE